MEHIEHIYLSTEFEKISKNFEFIQNKFKAYDKLLQENDELNKYIVDQLKLILVNMKQIIYKPDDAFENINNSLNLLIKKIEK